MNSTRMVSEPLAVGMLVSSVGVQAVKAQGNAGEIQVALEAGSGWARENQSNDLINYGIYGRYGLSNGWLLGRSVDMSELESRSSWLTGASRPSPQIQGVLSASVREI
ncbi:MAG: hypothetical protein PHG55_02690 [Verrucomicrobiota bacterium]|nr:hypothetical protein [Verrucomicrobiota bacterium]